MMVQHLKRRPLSRYLKDFKHSQMMRRAINAPISVR